MIEQLFVSFLNTEQGRVVVPHAGNPGILGARGKQISELEASLVYRVSFPGQPGLHRGTLSQKNQIQITRNQTKTKNNE